MQNKIKKIAQSIEWSRGKHHICFAVCDDRMKRIMISSMIQRKIHHEIGMWFSPMNKSEAVGFMSNPHDGKRALAIFNYDECIDEVEGGTFAGDSWSLGGFPSYEDLPHPTPIVLWLTDENMTRTVRDSHNIFAKGISVTFDFNGVD